MKCSCNRNDPMRTFSNIYHFYRMDIFTESDNFRIQTCQKITTILKTICRSESIFDKCSFFVFRQGEHDRYLCGTAPSR